ncbi:MAG: phospholipase/carboxylesterase [Actinoplanes sp.]|nr:phospholipase/carboxylesterase [Actinoplanes sp.]
MTPPGTLAPAVVASAGSVDPSATLVVLLHGRGSHEREIIALADRLPPGPAYVAVRAPIAEGGGYAWFANRGIGRPVAESLRTTTSAPASCAYARTAPGHRDGGQVLDRAQQLQVEFGQPGVDVAQDLSALSGPFRSAKLRVLMAWIPAVCSPLNGVTVAGQPALTASAGELNQKPTWKV